MGVSLEKKEKVAFFLTVGKKEFSVDCANLKRI